jgi:SAM-dependent methyltransferase
MSSSRKNNADDAWSSSDDDDDDDDDDEELDDDDDDEDRLAFYPICGHSRIDPSSSPAFLTLEGALMHDVDIHGFDLLRHLPPSTAEDVFYEGAIIAVNVCRRFVEDSATTPTDPRELGERLSGLLTERRSRRRAKGADDDDDDDDDDDARHYRPVLADDAVLMCMDELRELKRRREEGEGGEGGTNDGVDDEADDGAAVATTRTTTNDESDATTRALRQRVSTLEGELARARACVAALVVDDDDGSGASSSGDDECDSRGGGGRRQRQRRRGGGGRKSENRKKDVVDNDSYYFTSYSHTSIHETMLSDDVRTCAYEGAILSNAVSLFGGKTVLDVGCGTGVLSLFCAKAGAKKVIAVDNSDVIEQAREISRLNGQDGVVTFVRGKMEDLLVGSGPAGLPLSEGETVDVIVSEWMGYALFFETMLPSVLAARDAVMTPGSGTMFPNVSRIYVEGGSDGKRLDYWNDVHGFNMAPMGERMASELVREAWVELVDDGIIVTNRAMLIEHDLNTCKDEDLDFDAPFCLRPRDGGRSSDEATVATVDIHMLVISFDIDFAVPGTKSVSFSTGCQTAPTHWKQVVLWFDTVHNCPKLVGGEVMRGTFRMKRNGVNHRSIDMCVSWETGKCGDDGVWVRNMDGVMRRSLIA